MSPNELRQLSELLDQALALPLAARDAWLAQLGPAAEPLKPMLRQLLDKERDDAAGDLVDTRPRFALAAADQADPVDPGAAAAHGADFQPGDRIGPFTLLRELGHGGMGEVWLAHRSDGLLQRPIALKLPLLGGRRSVLAQRFARERDILGRLTHPHIARLYDAGVADNGQPYLALEYIEGRPITEFCDAHHLAARERVQLMLQVIDALQFAHANLVVHRDLKPSNVLVGAEGQVRLLDFGIAKLLDDEQATALETDLTREGGRALTLGYAAPEQVTGEPISIATDVYGTGVLLYELLAGRRPHAEAATRSAQEQAITSDDAARPSLLPAGALAKVSASVAADLDTIVLKALKKQPSERYPTVNALADDLRRWLAGEAVLAQPDSAGYRLRKFVGRHKLGVGLAVTLSAVVLASSGVAFWQAGVARVQSERAHIEAQQAQEVKAFLEHIFRANTANQSDPAKARQTTAREMLDLGAASIDSQLASSPRARYELLETLALMYEELGLYDDSVKLTRKRIALARELFGAGSLELAEALLQIVSTLEVKPDDPERLQAAQEAVALFNRMPAQASQRLAAAYSALGSFFRLRDPVQASAFTARALVLLRQLPPSEQNVSILTEAAIDALTKSHWAEGRSLAREGLAMADGLAGKAQGHVVTLMSVQGACEGELGELDAALQHLQAAWARSLQFNGADHIYTIQSAIKWAQARVQAGQAAEAEVDLRAMARQLTASARPDQARLLALAHQAHGAALQSLGLLAEALQAESQALAVVGGQIPPQVIQAQFVRARVLGAQGDTLAAQQALQVAQQVRLARNPDSASWRDAERAESLRLALVAAQGDEALTLSAPMAAPWHPDVLSVQTLDRADLRLRALTAVGQSGTVLAEAQALLARVEQSPQRRGLVAGEQALTEALALALLRAGQAEAGHALALRAVQSARALVRQDVGLLLAGALVTRAQTALGLRQCEAADAALREAEGIVRKHRAVGLALRSELGRAQAQRGACGSQAAPGPSRASAP